MNSSIKVALAGKYFNWGGGIELLRIIANALMLENKDIEIKLFLLLPMENKIACVDDFLAFSRRVAGNIIKLRNMDNCKLTPVFNKTMLDYFDNVSGKISTVYYNNTDNGFIACLKKINADVVLPVSGTLGRDFPIPWIGYIFDFQHKYHPNYFTHKVYLNRDISFASILRDAKAVLVNAEAVKNDISKYFPYHGCKVFNMPFAPVPMAQWLEQSPRDLKIKYNLPDKYFIISNQFWVHKDHWTAIQALEILVQRGVDVHIICTGNTNDPRVPEFFNELKEKIKRINLLDKIHILGHIPKMDQIGILKNALAVLQPTLFEGGPGGGSVYDAVSLGIPSIISDIPVNQEIKENNIFFFSSGSSIDMANKMLKVLSHANIRPANNILIRDGNIRTQRLQDKLLEAITHVIDNKSMS